MTFVEIRDTSDPRLAVYRDLHQGTSKGRTGRFIAEGRHLVQRLLASSLTTDSILCHERLRGELHFLDAAPLPVYLVPRTLINEIVGFKFHRGMLACGLRPANATLEELIATTDGPHTMVICPHIVDPINLASVVRNCAAFGVDGLLLGPHCTDVYSRRVVRVSMGSVFQMPIRVTEDLEAELRTLKDRWDYHCVATVLDSSATCLPSAERTDRLALLLGSEGQGLEHRWIAMCDEHVTLPMQQNIDSLNVATASGVFLYHYAHVAVVTARHHPPSESR